MIGHWSKCQVGPKQYTNLVTSLRSESGTLIYPNFDFYAHVKILVWGFPHWFSLGEIVFPETYRDSTMSRLEALSET